MAYSAFAQPSLGTAIGNFGFSVREPTKTSNFIDSAFSLTLFSGTSAIGNTSFAPADESLTLFGVWADQTFDRIEIVEATGGGEDEFFWRLREWGYDGSIAGKLAERADGDASVAGGPAAAVGRP